jgi:hypothetical protein
MPHAIKKAVKLCHSAALPYGDNSNRTNFPHRITKQQQGTSIWQVLTKACVYISTRRHRHKLSLTTQRFHVFCKLHDLLRNTDGRVQISFCISEQLVCQKRRHTVKQKLPDASAFFRLLRIFHTASIVSNPSPSREATWRQIRASLPRRLDHSRY